MALPTQQSRGLGDLMGVTRYDFAKRIARNTALWVEGVPPEKPLQLYMRVHDDDVLRISEYSGNSRRMYIRTDFVTKLVVNRLNTFGPEGGRFELTDGVIYYAGPDGQNVHPLGAEWGEYPYIRCKIEDRL